MIRHDYPNVAYYVADLMKEPTLLRWNQRYFLCVGAGLAAPTLVAGLATGSLSGAFWGFAWGGVVRIFVVEQTMSAINSLAHLFGTQPFDSRGDGSRNLGWLGALSWGEAWHNNHHAFPWSAAFGLNWRQADPGFWLIRLLERLGLAWDVRQPDSARIDARRLANHDDGATSSHRVDVSRKI
jgi:stearoyl-CoA desaturase (delta-9 desaturase)